MNKKLIFVLGAVVIVFVVSVIIFNQLLKPVLADDSRHVDFKIEQGMGTREIARELYLKNLIKSEWVFGIFSFLNGRSFRFKPGVYELNFSQSIPEIMDILTAGPEIVSVIVTPGMTLNEIDDEMSNLKILNKGELSHFDFKTLQEQYPFLAKAKSLEGFLFPDSYLFFVGSEPKDVVEKILDNFSEKTAPVFGKDLAGSSPATAGSLPALRIPENDDIFNKLILASILEKEIPDYRESRIAAGILEKRIRNGMPLQIDATVIYAKCGGRFSGCKLNQSDFKINSAFNTYIYLGYPPTPISNPALEFIKAALNPIKSEYWYYLSDPITKKTIFSKTLDEHAKNREKYLLY
ncbi:endolytic transglycosylase MltG [Candidatus Wolfebacteria bacterium]|nr:endolytic transglycosylase MltG [Candidatus Wolfebacteria bacterium]